MKRNMMNAQLENLMMRGSLEMKVMIPQSNSGTTISSIGIEAVIRCLMKRQNLCTSTHLPNTKTLREYI